MRFYKNLFIIAVLLIMSFGFTACSGGTTGEAGTGGTITEDDGSGTVTDGDGVQTSMKDWKWYENKECTLYARSSTGSDSIQEHTVSLPFFEGTGSAACDLFRINPEDVDMYPEDGWVLVSADFGTRDKAPVIPYFMLYNRASGTLRYVFYYAYDEPYTHALVKLEQQQGQTLMFSFYDSIKCFVKDKDNNIDYDPGKSLVTVTNVSPDEWSYADFVISYDPTVTDTEDLCFTIKIYGVKKSDVELGGDITLNQVFGNNRQKHSASISAGDVLSAGQKAVDYYKSVQEFAASSEASKGEWYSGILNAAGAAITASGPWGPVVGALAGIASSGIFGGKSSRPVPMNFKGTITLTGTITENNLIYSFLLSVPGTEISNSDSSNLSFYNKPLGIFSIKSKPVVDITVNSWISNERTNYDTFNSVYSYSYVTHLSVSSIKLKDSLFPEISLNNIDGFYVDKVEMGFVFSNESATNLPMDKGIDSDDWNIYIGYTASGNLEKKSYRMHENEEVEFLTADAFHEIDFPYSEKAVLNSGFHRYWCMSNYGGIDNKDIKTIASVVAPEIAIKVTMYANSDTGKENPIIHLKRIRADYNLYWHHIDLSTTHVTDYLGFFTN